MKTKVIVGSLLIMLLTMSCRSYNTGSQAIADPGATILLQPRAAAFDIHKVPEGAVGFTASIKNEGMSTITIAHPSICSPADYNQATIRHFRDSHGKSEILLKITTPDGSDIILRDGYLHYFDPGNAPLVTIPPKGTGTFDVGWFFQNARGRWEQDDEAAKVFLLKGTYKIRILFRNVFPKAVVYDKKTKERKCIDVWTGEMESTETTIEVK